MALQSSNSGLLIRGSETPDPTMEETGNLLRDITFLHDRLLVYGLNQSEFQNGITRPLSFYTRSSRGSVKAWSPIVKRLTLGSPFELVVVLPAISLALPLSYAFIRVMEGISMVGPNRSVVQAEANRREAVADRERAHAAYIRSLAKRAVDHANLPDDLSLQNVVAKDVERILKSPIDIDDVQQISVPGEPEDQNDPTLG